MPRTSRPVPFNSQIVFWTSFFDIVNRRLRSNELTARADRRSDSRRCDDLVGAAE